MPHKPARTSSFDACDQHGRKHRIVERTEVRMVKFANGSTGAEVGHRDYLLYGHPLQKVDENQFEMPDGSLKLRRV